MSKSTVADCGECVREEYSDLIGKHVGLYGPNFIWTGKLHAVTEESVVLTDVCQVYETNAHSDNAADCEKINDYMVFPRNNICNIGIANWAKPKKSR
jgi:hypothetical protein